MGKTSAAAGDTQRGIIGGLETRPFFRNLAISRLGVGVGVRLGGHLLLNAFRGTRPRAAADRAFYQDQAERLAGELGRLKGGVMKAGQLLALFGQPFLPPEAIAVLAQLHELSRPVAWPQIAPALERALGRSRMAELEIDETPIGAASLGQVHRARRIVDGAELCLKIQYPGVADAIDSDVQSLARLLILTRLAPPDLDLGPVMAELRRLLRQEADYVRERRFTEEYGRRLAGDPLFFSLGHSAIAIVLTLLMALTAYRFGDAGPWLVAWGVPASLLASAAFLTVIGSLNLAVLGARSAGRPAPAAMFDRVTGSGSMFPLGLVFGLNLDTAAEVLLLAASAAAIPGLELPLWATMTFPLLFMAGMAAADSGEALLMLRLYDWAAADADRSLRLNTATTALSAGLALGVAALQWCALARWAHVPVVDIGLAGDGVVVGAGVTALMTGWWMLARLQRAPSAVADSGLGVTSR